MSIKFNDVSFYYEKKKKGLNIPAISHINLEIKEQDEFVMIIGHTGSGKSTLLSHINGLLIPSEGSLDVLDFKITYKKRKNPKLKKLRQRIGYVFQFPEYQLFDETVLKDMAYAPKNFGLSLEEAVKSAKEAAKQLGITDLLDKSPFELSGGQMRKVAIGGILAYNPDIYLLDEPTRGLDPVGAKETIEFFNHLHKDFHKTMIMITHDMNLVYEYATRVIVLDGGKIIFDGKKEEFFQTKYQELGFSKPDVLKAIDMINEKLHYNLPCEIYNLEQLVEYLEVNDHE